MNDITITLTRQESLNLKLLFNAAVAHGIADSLHPPQLRASALMFPLLVKLEQAEQQKPSEPVKE